MLFSMFKPKKYFQNIIITHNEDAKIIFKQVLTNFRTIICLQKTIICLQLNLENALITVLHNNPAGLEYVALWDMPYSKLSLENFKPFCFLLSSLYFKEQRLLRLFELYCKETVA